MRNNFGQKEAQTLELFAHSSMITVSGEMNASDSQPLRQRLTTLAWQEVRTMAAKNSKSVKAEVATPAAPVAPTPADMYKANVARQAEVHAVITQRQAPFCMRAGVGSRAWALDLAICELHAEGAVINVQNMCRRANELLAKAGSSVHATPGSHFAALIQRRYLARGVNGYALTEHGVKQAEACGALKPAPQPAARKPKGKK